MASDLSFNFADLFAGIGGFHAALDQIGGKCVYVSEIDEHARKVYERNWLRGSDAVVNTDITMATPPAGDLINVPEHIDVLTAGFPCQPFSKSGQQKGMEEARGTLFWNIARVLEERHPKVILLENVRNLAGPRHKHEWDVIIKELVRIGYRVSYTPTIFSPHLLPPEMGGTPQVRDRVFILGTYVGEGNAPDPHTVPPTLEYKPVNGWDPMRWNIEEFLDDDSAIRNLDDYKLTDTEISWIQHWDDLIEQLPEWKPNQRMPGFPLWVDSWVPRSSLDDRDLIGVPAWKRNFLVKNAEFYDANSRVINRWLASPILGTMPPSRRKLEWQAQETKSLWETVMHFRPSGIRAKKPTYLPALVAITQTSIIGGRRRRITPHEAARLQGLPDTFDFGSQGDALSYKQVGNGVCVGAALYVLTTHVKRDATAIPANIVQGIIARSEATDC